MSAYAGCHAQRRIDPDFDADTSCWADNDAAESVLRAWGWEAREQEFRDRSRALVEKHWSEIEAVARDLIIYRVLHEDEVMQLADAAAGDPDADIDQLRQFWARQLAEFREQHIRERDDQEDDD